MNESMQEFIRSLEMSGYKYSVMGNNQLSIVWTNNSIPPITTAITFSNDGSEVEFKSSLMTAPADKQVDTLYVCSALNMQNRWVKFYINGENCLIAESNSLLECRSAGYICLRLLQETREVIGALYWTMMRVILQGMQSLD